jgi:tetratricopeptide (TPR) repeat protein
LVTYFYDWKFDEGLRLLRKAVEHNSGSALARQWYAYTLDAAGQFAEARAEFAHARQLDPVSEQLHWFATWPWYYERRYDRAIEALNQIRAEDAGYWPTYLLLGESYEALGNLPRALELLQKARDLGGNPWVVASIARVQAEAGRPEDARRIFRELVSGRDTAYVQAYALATVQARLGERDRAFELLEESFRDRTEDMCMLRIDPRVDPLRSDPRFASLMRLGGS